MPLNRLVLLVFLLLFSTTLYAESESPESSSLKKIKEDYSLCEGEPSECLDKVLSEEHKRREMHKGVSYNDFTSSLSSSDYIGYLEEGVEQSKDSLALGDGITASLTTAILSGSRLMETGMRANQSLSSASEIFGEYGKMLLLVHKQLLVSYKIESTLLQNIYAKEMQEEIIDYEKDE